MYFVTWKGQWEGRGSGGREEVGVEERNTTKSPSCDVVNKLFYLHCNFYCLHYNFSYLHYKFSDILQPPSKQS